MVIAISIGAAIGAVVGFIIWCCIVFGRDERAELP